MNDMANIITVLINKCGLGELESDIVPASGGLMHRMFKIKTSTGMNHKMPGRRRLLHAKLTLRHILKLRETPAVVLRKTWRST